MVKQTRKYLIDKLFSAGAPSIPDARKLQEVRLRNVGKLSPYEKFAKDHYRKSWETMPRIARITPEDQKKIYSLSIPLSFPILDWAEEIEYRDTDFSHWRGEDWGAINLTNSESFKGLIKILSHYEIPMDLGILHKKIFDMDSSTRFAIMIPQSFREFHYGPPKSESSTYIFQLVILDEDLTALPYCTLEELTLSSFNNKTEEKFSEDWARNFGPSYFDFRSNGAAKIREFHLATAFFSKEHREKPQDYLPRFLKKKAEEKIGNTIYINTGKLEGLDWKIEKSKFKILKFGDPVTIYDPSWIKT